MTTTQRQRDTYVTPQGRPGLQPRSAQKSCFCILRDVMQRSGGFSQVGDALRVSFVIWHVWSGGTSVISSAWHIAGAHIFRSNFYQTKMHVSGLLSCIFQFFSVSSHKSHFCAMCKDSTLVAPHAPKIRCLQF